MVVKFFAVAGAVIVMSNSTAAGWSDFWPFQKQNPTTSYDDWDRLTDAQQLALLKRYQNLKEIPDSDSSALQQRMEWFTQLSNDEKRKMRLTWQRMSSQERQDLRKRMQNATPEQRNSIRNEYLQKYHVE